MKPRAAPVLRMLVAGLALMICACGEKSGTTSVPAAEALVGDLAESVLSEIRYKRITDRAGSTVRGGERPPHPILELDAKRYKPLATHWAGIKSLDPIPGHGDRTFFRYTLTAELYPDAGSAKRRDDGFDAAYAGHMGDGGTMLSKEFRPVLHFSHERVFYLLATDMSASADPNETGKLKFALLKHLTR